MLLYENAFCLINLEKEQSLLRLKWLQQPDSGNYEICFREFLRLSDKYSIKYMLSDNSKGIYIDLATQRWTIETGSRQMQHTSVKKYARILPAEAFQEVVTYKLMDTLNSMFPDILEFEIFTSAGSARAWLLNSKKYVTEVLS